MERERQLREAYRLLLRYGYRACERTHPHRTILRNYLRQKFRNESLEPPSATALANTVKFVKAAAEWTGLERRCIATMIHVEHSKYEQSKTKRSQAARKRDQSLLDFNSAFYESIITGLNKSMDLCL